jgi:hypothetical protein
MDRVQRPQGGDDQKRSVSALDDRLIPWGQPTAGGTEATFAHDAFGIHTSRSPAN